MRICIDAGLSRWFWGAIRVAGPAIALAVALAACGGGGGSGGIFITTQDTGSTSVTTSAAPESPIASGQVIALPGSGFVVSRQVGSTSFVVQRFSADGQASGAEVTVAPAMAAGDSGATRVPLAGGGFAVMWQRLLTFGGLGGSLFELMTQGFGLSGLPLGVPQASGQTIPGFFSLSRPIANPQLAALAGGGFVIAWALPSSSDFGVYAQRFSAAGTPAGTAQQVAADGSGFLGLAGLASGGTLVTWTAADGEGFARAFSVLGVPLGPARSTGPAYLRFGNANPPVIAPLAGGGAVMAWLRSESVLSSTGYVHLVQLGPDGTALAVPITVDGSTAPAAPHGTPPAVAALADGGYVVAWIESGTLHARRFAADGAARGAEARVNAVTTEVQAPIGAAGLAGGGFVIAWSGQGADGSRGSFARRFAATGLVGVP